MKPTWEQVKAFAESDLEEEKIPGPYAVALALAGPLLASGRYDDPAAAVETAWTLVFPYYQGRASYERHGRILFDLARHASAPEGEMTRGEAQAYVTGGETGDMGEGAPGRAGPRTATVAVTVTREQADQARERWERIAAADKAMREADEVLQEARHVNLLRPSKKAAKALEAAKEAWNAAAKVQSEAHT